MQARDELITRTFESLHGAKKAIVHLYNSTSPLQRRVVFGLEKPEIIHIATRGAKLVKELVPTLPGTQVIMQYSPESFSSTGVDFAEAKEGLSLYEAHKRNFTVDKKQEANEANKVCKSGVICLLYYYRTGISNTAIQY